ncbi:glycosyltransferase family 4 protein [Fischerella sp. JS2]|uniref:glycosyltransferase family 4 protein n=1 Tax=Fischerella sp. JS2 TaxID=2597771 RepID=UPI0028E324DA|nr:glycosyltransferase family 4 protein [Fischerella sp. JS2]
MNKRLLLISSNSSDRGGGERYLIYLTKGLRLLDCEVHVLLSTASYMDNWAKLLIIEGAHVHRKNLLGLRSRPLRFVQSIVDQNQQLEIAKSCQQISPDAILVNQQYDEDGLDYVAGALMSQVAPVGGIIHMPMTAHKHQRLLGNFRGKLLRKWYKKHPYSLILVSKDSQKEFENYYSYPRPTKVVNHGCEFSEIITSHPSLPSKWSEPLPIIGFSGQFVLQKNLQLLIDAWLWTIKQGMRSRLLLIGDGPERQNLDKYLRENAPENTWYITGWQEHPEAYLSVLDIYAMTSHFEGLPLALIEAAGRGIPAVVTNFNGASDIAEHALWVSVATDASPESFGNTLINSINQLSWLKQQATNGQQDFQKYFSLQRMASETLVALGIA